MTSRAINLRLSTAVSFLLRGRPVILSLINLVVGDKELLSDLLI